MCCYASLLLPIDFFRVLAVRITDIAVDGFEEISHWCGVGKGEIV